MEIIKDKRVLAGIILAVVMILLFVFGWANKVWQTEFWDNNSWIQEIDQSKNVETNVNEWNVENEAKNENNIDLSISQ
jgi:hypothetical protein